MQPRKQVHTGVQMVYQIDSRTWAESITGFYHQIQSTDVLARKRISLAVCYLKPSQTQSYGCAVSFGNVAGPKDHFEHA